MLVVVVYDINTESTSGEARLRRVAKECVNYGQRVQNSVFECLVDPVQLKILQEKLSAIMNPDVDSIRYYYLGKNWQNKVEHIGAKPSYDPEGFLAI